MERSLDFNYEGKRAEVRTFEFSPFWTLVVNIFAWLLVHIGVSYLFLKMPDAWFSHTADRKKPQTKKSKEELIYERLLFIRIWKDKLPDGGSLFRGGFAKKKIAVLEKAYLQTFILETRRGEWTHIISMLPAPLFFLWNESIYGWIMIVYAIVANVPFIIVQRYNRFRLQRIFWKLKEKSEM